MQYNQADMAPPCSEEAIDKAEQDLRELLVNILAEPLRQQTQAGVIKVLDGIDEAIESLSKNIRVDCATGSQIQGMSDFLHEKLGTTEDSLKTVIAKIDPLSGKIELASREAKSAMLEDVRQTANSAKAELLNRFEGLDNYINGRVADVEQSLRESTFRTNAIFVLALLNLAALVGVLWLLVR